MSAARRRLVFAGQLLLGLLLIGTLAWFANVRAVGALLCRTHPGWLACVFLLMLSAYAARCLVHQRIAAVDGHVPLWRLFLATMVGNFFSNLLPAQIGGDIVRGVYLFEYFPSRSRTYASLIVLRTLGGIGSLIVALASAAWLVPPTRIAVVAIACALTAGAWWFFRLALRPMTAKDLVEHGLTGRLRGIARRLVHAVLSYRRHKAMLGGALAASCGITLISVAMYLVAAQALGVSMNWRQALFTGSATQLSALVPGTPGGLGIGEGTFVIAAKEMGVAAGQALAVSLLIRGVAIIISLLGGLLYLLFPVRLADETTSGPTPET